MSSEARLTSTVFPADDEVEELLVGTESITWRIASDARLWVVMLYPLLLQVAHPTVGAGVRDFSDFERHPWKRLLGTLDYVSLLVYGGREAALAGRRLREMHRRMHGLREDGKRYHALEPEAYAWVHATLLMAYAAGHARFGTPLGDTELRRFYGEYRGLGRLIGVRYRDLPDDWDGFLRYCDHMVARELVHTEAVDQVLRALRSAPAPPAPISGALWPVIRMPARRALWLGGVGLLGPSLRERLDIRWSRLDEAQFRALGIGCRSLTPVMPESLRVMGPGQLRYRERAIAGGPLVPGGQ
ncbi:MAG: oxygenase MpaB family protein [Solirubrobacteraceae bacterium]